MPNRRSVIAAGISLAGSALWRPSGAFAAAAELRLGKPQRFSFDEMAAEMRSRAAHPYGPPGTLPQRVLDRITYEALGRIRFNTDYALFRDGPGQFPVTFFLPGNFFRTPVRMYALAPSSQQWVAREILYDPDYFSMPADSPARDLPRGAGFAGFRLQESREGGPQSPDWHTNDWVSFLGASYFRAIGDAYQYGLSARGIAVDVAVPGHSEEFPDFTRFYFEPPAEHSREVTVYAALDGPSLTGAYRFIMRRDAGVLIEVEARLFPRRAVAQLGLAPMTSMYWFSETLKPRVADWRPEVHDSDGLSLWTGAGERIWRPLNNPSHPSTSTFADHSPRGFGLLQRDRAFDHYLDGVHYERRPSLWVEPLGDWGEGCVQLLELPTDDEVHDNIVAMWVPKRPVEPGDEWQLRYRLYWGGPGPQSAALSQCIATRTGLGGEPGHPRPKGAHKFIVEFLGGPLATLPYGTRPQPVLSAPSGTFSDVFTEAVPDSVAGHWRAHFDFTASDSSVVDIRLYLRDGVRPLSETWLYQYRTA